MTSPEYSLIIEELRRRIGLEPGSLGDRVIKAAVDRRVAERKLHIGSYVARLCEEPAEFDELVEEIIVPESWFFRDTDPFKFLRKVVREGVKRSATNRLRILSIPCSTGEEPYSLAAVALDSGLKTGEFSITGVDISRRNLKTARTGVYSEYSFRERSSEAVLLTERFLRRVDKTRIVADELRRSVSFVHGNLVDKNFLAGERPFDLIFCRNVLIYFHTIGRKSALENLRRLLDDEGVLYVGHSEAGVMRVADFEVADAQFPFSFRKKVAVERGRNSEPNLFDLGSTSARILPFVSTPAAKNSAPAGAKSSAAVPTKVVTLPTVAGSTNQPLTSTSSSAAESKTRSQTGVDAVSLIEQARSAADRGDLDAAEKLCLRSLEANSLDAGGQSLLGIIRKARGDLRAANQAFEQALYLDPDHLEALTHLFLDAERRGDRTSADRLRRRLDRIGSNDRRGDR